MSKDCNKFLGVDYFAWLQCQVSNELEQKPVKYQLVKAEVDADGYKAIRDDKGNTIPYTDETGGVFTPSTIDELVENETIKDAGGLDRYNQKWLRRQGYALLPVDETEEIIEDAEVKLEEVPVTAAQYNAKVLGGKVFYKDLGLGYQQNIFNTLGKEIKPELSFLGFKKQYTEEEFNTLLDLGGPEGYDYNVDDFLSLNNEQQSILDFTTNEATQQEVLNNMFTEGIENDLDKCKKSPEKCVEDIYKNVSNQTYKFLNKEEQELYTLNQNLQIALKNPLDYDEDFINDLKEKIKSKRKGLNISKESNIYDPETGEFVSLTKGAPSDIAVAINEDARTLVFNNQIENNGDIGILQAKQTELYYKIIGLAKTVMDAYPDVTDLKDKSKLKELVQGYQDLFTDDRAFKDLKKMAEKGELPDNLRMDYFTRGDGVLARKFNETINEFLVTSRAIALNKNPIEDEDNKFLEGLNRKFTEFTGVNLLNEEDYKNVLENWDVILGEEGIDFLDQVKANERLRTNLGELTYNTTLDLVPFIAGMGLTKKVPGFKPLMNSLDKVGAYFTNPKVVGGLANSKYWKGAIQAIVGSGSYGTDGKFKALGGASGIKELIAVGGADKILEYGFGHKPMPGDFGFILGTTNSIMEQRVMAAALVRLSQKIPGIRYLYKSESGKKVINTLVGSTIGTAGMTITEAAQYSLGTSEYEEFKEVFFGNDPHSHWANKLASLYISFAAIGLGNTSTAKAIYRDAKARAKNVTRRELDGAELLNINSKYDPKTAANKEESFQKAKDRDTEINNAYDKAVSDVKNNKKLSLEEKAAKIEGLRLAKENLLEAREYRDLMLSLEKTETYGKTLQSNANRIVDKAVNENSFNIGDLNVKDIDFIAGTDVIILSRSIANKYGMEPKQAKQFAEQMQRQAETISNTANSIVGGNRSGRGGELRAEVIKVLQEAGSIQKAIEQLSNKKNQQEYGITAKLQIEQLREKLSELENSLKEKVNEAGDIAVEKAFDDAALMGEANVKVNLLTAEQYAAKGFEESEGVFVQKAGEIFINTDILRTTKSQNVVVHEVGHKLVLGALKDTAGNLTPNGERILTEFRELIPEQQKKIVEDALSKNYKNKSRKEQLEEFFTIFSEKLADGQIQLGAGGKAIGEINNASDLLNLSIRLQDNLKRIADGTTNKLDANLVEAIEKYSTKANTEGAVYKKFEPTKDAGDLGVQLNELITTKNKMEFMETDWLNIDTNLREGNFDFLFEKVIKEAITPEVKARLRDKLATRLVGSTEKGGYDPAQGKFGTWIYGNIEKAYLDVKKDLFKESENRVIELNENVKQIIDTGTPKTEVPLSISTATIKRRLRLTADEIDLVKTSISTPILEKIRSVEGTLTKKDIQQLRKDFIKAEGPDGKLRKLILRKVNELGKDGLQTKEGIELIHDISLSRMTNSLKGGGKGFSIFLEPVLKPNGEQARYSVEEANALGIPLEKSGSGPLKYKKRPLSDFIKDGKPTQEYLDWIQGKDIASGARGRKNSIINELTGEIGIEAMLSVMTTQKIIKPIRDKDGKIIGTEEVDLFPNATPSEKMKMATDAVVNFIGDKISRVYKETSNLLYSKKEIKKFSDALLDIKHGETYDLQAVVDLFNKQPKDFKELFNKSAPGSDFTKFIEELATQKLEENLPFYESELKKGDIGYYEELVGAYKNETNYKKYLNKIGVKYTPEKDLVKPENIERTKTVLKDFVKMFGPWKDLTKEQQTYILGAIGFGKSLRKELGLTLAGRTREQMLIDVFGKDVLKGEGDIVLPDIKVFDPSPANKNKIAELIKNSDKYTPQELRNEFVKLMLPKGKGPEYFNTMIEQNKLALNKTLDGLLNTYEKSTNKTKTLENIVNFLKLQTNFNQGLKALFPITSILLEAKGSINKKGEVTDKILHFEHNKELFNFSKTFIEILRKKIPQAEKQILIEKLIDESTQSIISEQFRSEKDADGRTVASSIDPLSATYIARPGAASMAIDLTNPLGGTVQERINLNLANQVVENILRKSDQKDINITEGIKQGEKFGINSEGKYFSIKDLNQYNESLSKNLNEILERTKGIGADVKVSAIEGKVLGRDKSPLMKYFYGAEDFGGLTYSILSGKGEKGNVDIKFFKDNLVEPYNRGVAKTETYSVTLKQDYSNLLKNTKIDKVINKLPGTGKGLNKIIENTKLTYDQAIRAYLWTKSGYKIPGLEAAELNTLLTTIKNNPELKSFADQLMKITKQGKWTEPGEYWNVRNLNYDLLVNQVNRARTGYLGQFNNNVDAIFSKQNLNKLEALYGEEYRSALESSIRRMKSGSNRPGGGTATENAFLNWTNNSVGAIMFFNRRSAVLQTLSTVNFLNWGDNNPIQAAKAFANQKQFWSDFSYIWNSDKLKARRQGLGLDINVNEISKAVQGSKNKAAAALSYLLKIGFTPTQLADSFAISSGGATFYRNRINTYIKEGLTKAEAEKKAWEDFSRTSEEAQQSADASMISQQQASTMGRLVLAFQNTPMQYTRIITKSIRDLTKGRGDFKTNMSKIAYYGVVQNMMFASLQNALFSEIPGFDGEDSSIKMDPNSVDKRNKKVKRIVNNMFDTVARGYGVYGAMGSTFKNSVLKYMEQEEMDPFQKDHAKTLLEIINYSPPVGSKLRKIYNAIQTKEFEKDVIAERGWDVTYDGKVNISPSYNVIASVTEGATNIPLERTLSELNSMMEFLDTRNTAMQRLALLLGWRTWDVGASNEEMDELKVTLKERKKREKEEERKRKREEEKRLKEEARFEGLTNKEINALKTYDQIKALTRQQQVDSLLKLGLTKKEISALKYEDDRINKIIKLNTK